MQRRVMALLVLLLLIFLASCSDPDKAKKMELYQIFIAYDQSSSEEQSELIMDAFKKDIQLFLKTLAYTYDKQPPDSDAYATMLRHVGYVIAQANKGGDTTYADIIKEVEGLPLTKREKQELEYLNNNIAYWVNH